MGWARDSNLIPASLLPLTTLSPGVSHPLLFPAAERGPRLWFPSPLSLHTLGFTLGRELILGCPSIPFAEGSNSVL